MGGMHKKKKDDWQKTPICQGYKRGNPYGFGDVQKYYIERKRKLQRDKKRGASANGFRWKKERQCSLNEPLNRGGVINGEKTGRVNRGWERGPS